MSVEKNQKEAVRWFKTAKGDFESAAVLLKSERYAHACFHFQQAGEKAVKAVWYRLDADPWGHSITKLIKDLEAVDLLTFDKLEHLINPATLLDRFYITTRYPNGLPELTPEEAFLKEDAQRCRKNARMILAAIEPLMVK